MGSHYDVLGVAPDASTEEIRAAYRRLARERHPDVAGDSGESEMWALNAAYRALSDPGRRLDYDRALRAEARAAAMPRPATPASAVADPEPESTAPPRPARFPWRGFTVATTLAIAAVATASVLSGPPAPAVPDGILQPGSCVQIQPNTDAREVACTGVGDRVVRTVVPIGSGCPIETEPHRDHQGQGVACVAEPATATDG